MSVTSIAVCVAAVLAGRALANRHAAIFIERRRSLQQQAQHPALCYRR